MCIEIHEMTITAIERYIGTLNLEIEKLEEKECRCALSDAEEDDRAYLNNELACCNCELLARNGGRNDAGDMVLEWPF